MVRGRERAGAALFVAAVACCHGCADDDTNGAGAAAAAGGGGSGATGAAGGSGATGATGGSAGTGGQPSGPACPGNEATPDLSDQVLGMDTLSVDYFARPAKAEPFVDATFHTRITRVSDQQVDGYGDVMMRPFYAKHDHENADGSLVLLHDGGRWHLYEVGTWTYLRRLPDQIWGWTEPRWDAQDPRIFYFVDEMTFNRYEVGSSEAEDVVTTLRDFSSDFPSASQIWNEHEGDSDQHSRYWAFKVVDAVSTGMKIICYDREQDAIVGERDHPTDPNWVAMSPSGEYVVLGVSPFEAWDRTLTSSVTMVAGASGHADLAIAADGRDAICYHNHSHDWYSFSYLNTGEEHRVFQIEQWTHSGEHFSGNSYATPGWCAVSTYASSSQSGAGWQPSYWLDNAVFLMELTADSPRMWRLSHARTANTDYWTDPMGTINRCGTRFYWGANWSDPQGAIDTYVVDLPPGWWNTLMAQ